MQALCIRKQAGTIAPAFLVVVLAAELTRRGYFFFVAVRFLVERLAGAFLAVDFLRVVVDLLAVFFLVERLAVEPDFAFVEVFLAPDLAAEVFFFVDRLAVAFLAGAFFAGLRVAAVFFLGDRLAVARFVVFAGVFFLVAAISFWLLITKGRSF